MKDFHFNISPQQQERMIRGSLLAELEFVYAFIDQQNGQLNKYLEEFNCESETSEAHGFFTSRMACVCLACLLLNMI